MNWYEVKATHAHTGRPMCVMMMSDRIYGAYLRFRDLNRFIKDVSIRRVTEADLSNG